MHPQEFVNKWANSALGELQSGQAHFLDVCRLVGVEMPGGDGKTALTGARSCRRFSTLPTRSAR